MLIIKDYSDVTVSARNIVQLAGSRQPQTRHTYPPKNAHDVWSQKIAKKKKKKKKKGVMIAC